MPELPEVETTRRGLERGMLGRRFVEVETRRPDLRWPFPERMNERLEGTRLDCLRRLGKYLLADLSSAETLIMHLGMSGRFAIQRPGDGQNDFDCGPHNHVVFKMEDGHRIVYNDPRRFGMMDLVMTGTEDSHFLLAGLGPDPLVDGIDGSVLRKRLKAKKVAIKIALLDQGIIAGIGNIYASEALWRANMSPITAAGRMSVLRLSRLSDALGAVLAEAIEAGGATIRDHRQPEGSLGYFQHEFKVYGRAGEACMKAGCGGRIKKIVQSSRATFYCTRCQR